MEIKSITIEVSKRLQNQMLNTSHIQVINSHRAVLCLDFWAITTLTYNLNQRLLNKVLSPWLVFASKNICIFIIGFGCLPIILKYQLHNLIPTLQNQPVLTEPSVLPLWPFYVSLNLLPVFAILASSNQSPFLLIFSFLLYNFAASMFLVLVFSSLFRNMFWSHFQHPPQLQYQLPSFSLHIHNAHLHF